MEQLGAISESAAPSPFYQSLARGLVSTANFLTDVRDTCAPIAGALLATAPSVESDHRLWRGAITGIASALMLTDLEGRLVGIAKRLDPTIENPSGSIEDPKADKKLVNYLLGGLAAHQLLIERPAEAAFTAGALIINHFRDRRMNRTRARALERDPTINVGAILPNKVKTMLIMGGLAVATTPWSEQDDHHILADSLIAGGVAIGVWGYRKFAQLIERRLQANYK